MSQQQPQIQIEIDENTAKGTYSNLAMVSHSETEFILDFIFVQPQTAKSKVLSRIITSPLHLKRLLGAIQDNIHKYEERFGPIQSQGPLPTQDKPIGFFH